MHANSFINDMLIFFNHKEKIISCLLTFCFYKTIVRKDFQIPLPYVTNNSIEFIILLLLSLYHLNKVISVIVNDAANFL